LCRYRRAARRISSRGSWAVGWSAWQPIIVENKPGAGTNVGVQAVISSPPDGYTLLLVGTASAISATLYEKLPFNFLQDVTPVAGLVRFPLVMEVNRLVPAATVAEFIAYAKANPGKINMASSGVGTAPHLAGEMFKAMAGVNMVHVPYRGERLVCCTAYVASWHF
jgi:tripartite-type tricarboxylate transporter receptor subunit TctC